MKKNHISKLIGIFLVILLVMPMVFAKVAPNKGSNVSRDASDVVKQNANDNAAFNREGSTSGSSFVILTSGSSWSCGENYCASITTGVSFSLSGYL